MKCDLRTRPRGFTVMEVMVAMAILATAMVLVARLGCWSLRERARSAARQLALELAANVLESARAQAWEDLTAEWAASQRIPDAWSDRLTEGRLAVGVEPEASRPRTKRVIVEVHWMLDEGIESQPVRLISLFTARSAPDEGAAP